MPTITLTSGKNFQAPQGGSILDAATQAHITLPYSCKTGRCSTCKCKVINGVTRELHPESGLTAQEKSEGWILTCVRAPETDVQLDLVELSEIQLPAARTLPCRISEIIFLAPDVVKVLLRLPPAADFYYIPGQYVDVIGPGGIRRSYSLANSNSSEKTLELHIRAVDNGVMSDYWFKQAKPNDLLRLNGPLGTFFLRETAGVDLIFLATGTGIAPVKAMLESLPYLAPESKPKSVTVLWGGRKMQDFYLSVSDIFSDQTYVPVLSQRADAWTGAYGYIQDVLLGKSPDLSNASIYACGSDAMICSAKTRLIEAGLPARRYYSDAFVCSGAN
jgi:CDP-4-dehydro-6-deoxyglucose reductase